jgi:putative membrane protein
VKKSFPVITKRKMKNLGNISVCWLKWVLTFALIAAAFSRNFGQHAVKVSNPSGKQERSVDVYSVRDAEFLSRAAEINLEEISLGQLAQKRSMMEDVRDLGKMLEYVHSKSFKDLDALAKMKMIAIPNQETYNIQNAYMNLNDKPRTEFDKAYCDAMVMSYRRAIIIFEKAAKVSDDLDIRKWAAETLPTLQTYFQHSLSCLEKCDKARG